MKKLTTTLKSFNIKDLLKTKWYRAKENYFNLGSINSWKKGYKSLEDFIFMSINILSNFKFDSIECYNTNCKNNNCRFNRKDSFGKCMKKFELDPTSFVFVFINENKKDNLIIDFICEKKIKVFISNNNFDITINLNKKINCDRLIKEYCYLFFMSGFSLDNLLREELKHDFLKERNSKDE